MGSAPSAATAASPNDSAAGRKKDGAADAVRPISTRKADPASRSSHSSNNTSSNHKHTPTPPQPQGVQKYTAAATSTGATATPAAFVRRSSSFSANSYSGPAPLVLPPIAGAATPSSLSRQIIQQSQPPPVPPGHVPSPASRNRGLQRAPSASLLGRHSPASQHAQQHFPSAMLGHVTPSPRGSMHSSSGGGGGSAEKPSPPHSQKPAALQPTQRTSPSSSVHAPNSASSNGRRSSRGDPAQPNSGSSHAHSTTLVQPFQPISPPAAQQHARGLSLSTSHPQHSYSASPTPLHPQPPLPQPVPPAVAPNPGTASARGRKSLAVHTQLDPPHPTLTTFAPTPLPPAQPVVSHPSQQPVWFDTSAADEYLAAYGPSSPQSSRSPVLDMRDLEGVASWELPLPHNIVSDNHLMLQPFGVQQTHAMQVEEDMEYIMDRPIPAVDLEQPVVPKQVTPVAKPETAAPSTARRLRKHLSTGGGLVTAHMQAPPPIQTSSSHAPQHHIPTSGGGSATHSASSHSQSALPRQTSASAASASTVEGVDRALSNQTLSSLSASPASTDASAPPTLRPNSLQLTSPASASALSDNGSSGSRHGVGSPSTVSGGFSSSFASSSGGSMTSRSAAAAASLALAGNMPIDVALPIVQAAMYDESSVEYQEYKAKWIAEKEAAAKEAARTAAVDRAVAHGLLPPSHGRKSSRSMFGDSAGSPASGGSRALSPALVYSPIQPSSPLLMHRGAGGHHIPTSHSGYVSPMRSLSPMGSPHSPTIFATLLESNSRNASRNISPQPSSPMSRDRQLSPRGAGPGGGFGGAGPKGFGGGAGTHRHYASVINVPPHPSHDGVSGSHSGENTARSHSGGGGGGQPPRHGHSESLLCNTYDNLRLGWIPSDLSVSGAIPVPYK